MPVRKRAALPKILSILMESKFFNHHNTRICINLILNNFRPKHRGWKRQNGSWVSQGTILALQTKPRFFPGLNVRESLLRESKRAEEISLSLQVGFGKNATLFAMFPGKVYVTCEKSDMNFKKNWIQR